MKIAQMGRFTIRDVAISDTDYVFHMFSNPETVRYMGLRKLDNVMEALQLVERYMRSRDARWLAVCDGPKFLGLVGFEVKGHSATLTIASNGVRQGFGREFSVPFVKWVMSYPNIWRVWAICHVDNLPVQRVLKRMGAEREGRLRRFEMFPNLSREPQDVYMYSIVRS